MLENEGAVMAANGQWHAETSVDQDGLLPVVKFLQSALAMKAKVRWVLAREQEDARSGIMDIGPMFILS